MNVRPTKEGMRKGMRDSLITDTVTLVSPMIHDLLQTYTDWLILDFMTKYGDRHVVQHRLHDQWKQTRVSYRF